MVRNILIFVGLFLSINAFGQYPRIILKQLEKASEQGQLIIADSDSNAVWTSNLKVTVDSFLVLYGDTIEGGINYEKIQDTIAFMLEAGLGIEMTYNDADGQFLIESLALEDSIYNGTASPITKGTPLYAVGVQGNYWSVAPADASDISKLPAVVIAGEDIAAGATGLGLLKGHIKQVSTVGFADGDEVYVGVGGGYTNVKPKGEFNYVQRLGTVIKGNDANGSGIINLGEVQSVSNLNPGNIFIGDTDSTITTRVYIVDSTRVNVTNDSIIYYQNGVQIGADVFSATGVWTEDASYVYYNGGKNVGIGTTTPFRELHVKNSENNKTVILLENTENSPFSTAELNLGLGSQTFNFVNYSDSSASTIDGLAVKNKGVITTSNGMDGIIYAPINGQNYFLFNSRFDHDLLYVDATNDKIGIKDTTPTATFDVTGWVNITDSLVVNDIRVTGTGAGTINGVTTDATLTGDGTSGTPLSVVDDGHNHVISNVDFLQDSLTAKANASELSNYVTIAGIETITGAKTFTSDLNIDAKIALNAGDDNIVIGDGAGASLVSGQALGNVLIGTSAGAAIDSSDYNIANGYKALFNNESGSYNIANGPEALYNNINGIGNQANGNGALYKNESGSNNIANGYLALYELSSGSNNQAYGIDAGRYYGSGSDALTTATGSLFIGSNTRASANGNSNEIVIGTDAIGNGSNSVTIGNDGTIGTATTKTILNGNVGIGTTSPRVVSGYNNLVIDGSTSGLLEINANGTRVFSLYASVNDINLVNPTATGAMRFYTNNIERMRIDASGNVGIGETSPSAKLDVNGNIVIQNEETNTNAAELDLYKKNGSSSGDVTTGDNIGNINFKAENGATTVTSASIEVDATTLYNNEIGGDIVFKTASNFHSRPLTEAMRIDKLGNISLDSTLYVDASNDEVGIGTTSPGYKLDVNGDVRADTYYYDVGSSLVSSSDARLKTNIHSMNNVSDKLKSLNLIKYEWNDIMYKKLEGRTSQSKLGGTFEGMIAQQVESIFPEYVGIDKDGYKTLSYVSFIVPLLKGFQEQQVQIETIQAELDAKQSEIDQLKTLITDLTNRLIILENK